MAALETILVVNAGSSSVRFRFLDGADNLVASQDLGPPDSALADHLAEFVKEAGRPDVVGHRVVHGGSRFAAPTLVDRDLRNALNGLNELAPLHNPPALAGIDAARLLLPDVPSVACFDTAFHVHMPPAARSYALPADWVSRWGMRRYGFHGLSCAWAVRQASALVDRPAEQLRLIICHLGAGASVTATIGGSSVDTTMGFTPLEGLVMATRSGDVDPGIVLWALDHGLTVPDVYDALEHHSGLLGLSGGRSGDMRELLAARADGDEAANLAVAVYLHRLRAKIAAMAAATEGADAIVFTGGVGEHSAPIRAETVAGLDWLGVNLDVDANVAVAGTDADISAALAPVRTLVVHAREDLQIAHECRQLLGTTNPPTFDGEPAQSRQVTKTTGAAMSETARTPVSPPGEGDDPLAEIDGIMSGRAERLHDADDRRSHDEQRRQQFLTDFATLCKDELRPAMEAVIERLRADGGGGEIAESHVGSAHPNDPRLTAWISLEGEIVGHPRQDRNPYLQLDGESFDQVVQVAEGDMWQGHGAHSGRVATCQLSEVTAELVTEHLLAVVGRAAS